MEQFSCSHEQAEQFKMSIVKAMITGCVPFTFVENEYFRDAMRLVGVKPLSRKEVGGSYIDRIFEAEQEASTSVLETCEYICASSDGWRSKYCASGAGLMNFTTLPSSGAMTKQ
jgi:hypothetical protein